MLIDTNETCIVQGDVELMDTGMIRVSHFKSDVVVRNGDKVVTSNISDRYLQGIRLGILRMLSWILIILPSQDILFLL